MPEHNDDRPMPPHNLLVHVVGYVDRGCRACDWLRERGYLETPTNPTPGDLRQVRAAGERSEK